MPSNQVKIFLSDTWEIRKKGKRKGKCKKIIKVAEIEEIKRAGSTLCKGNCAQSTRRLATGIVIL